MWHAGVSDFNFREAHVLQLLKVVLKLQGTHIGDCDSGIMGARSSLSVRTLGWIAQMKPTRLLK